MIESFSIKPNNYKNRIVKIITLLSADRDNAREGINMLKELVSETEMFLNIK